MGKLDGRVAIVTGAAYGERAALGRYMPKRWQRPAQAWCCRTLKNASRW